MPEHRLALDPRNPGQFFACCGLFELSELVAPGGEAWFADGGREFVLSTDAPVPPSDLTLLPQPDLEGKPYDGAIEPLEIAIGERTLTLNWWLNETLSKKSALKSWGGHQQPRKHLLGPLLERLDYQTKTRDLFDASAYTRERFGVDARSAWEALDAGYSPNDIGQNATTFPWVEVLAVVGLQGFRPAKERRFRYRYAAWLTPLALAAARAACAALWPDLPSQFFFFSVAVRGQGYKTFQFAEGADHA